MRSRSPHFRAAVPRAPAPPTRRTPVGSHLGWIAAAGGLAVLLTFTTGCPGKGSQAPGAQSVERQSDSEYDLARDMFEKGNPRGALDHAMKAISLNEDNDKAHYYVAVIHLSFCSTDKGLEGVDCRLSEVEKHARAALKANGDFRDAKNLLGQVLVDEKRCKEAITVLEPLTKDPAYVHPYFAWGNLGAAQLCDGQVDAAITSLKNAVAEPRFCVGHYRLGLAYEKKGDLASAEASFGNAVSADPQCERLQDAWWGRSRVRKQLGNVEWKKDCEKCREISADTATGKLCIQMLAMAANQPATPTPTRTP
jgi:type IV pilus assembly protein PilF